MMDVYVREWWRVDNLQYTVYNGASSRNMKGAYPNTSTTRSKPRNQKKRRKRKRRKKNTYL